MSLMHTVSAAALAAAAVLGAAAQTPAEIRVLSAAAVQAPVEEIAAQFTTDTGHRVAFEFGTAGVVEARMKAGASPTVLINAQERIAAPDGDVSRVHPLGTVRIGIAARPGSPRPDLSSVEAFRASLLRAERIAYGDPARGSTTGIHFVRVLEQLGITAQVGTKARLAADGLDVMRLVKTGEVALGVTQISEILHVDRTTLVGPLPDALQKRTTYAAVLLDPAHAPASALIERLVSAAGRARFRAAGFE